MAKFFLVRHGQTAWNKDQRFRGRKDVPLSDQGRREAEAVADAFSNESIDYIFASPLSRAMQTLEPLASRLGKEVVPLEGIIDMDFGDWEGMAGGEVKDKYPDLFNAWKEAPHTADIPRGESLDGVQARAMRALSRLGIEHPEAAIVLCSHRVVCKLVMLGLFGARADKFWVVRQDTTCINRFEYDPPRAVVYAMNDTHHLAGLGGTLKADF